jgi:eukaryotic-like serine/threonine-protein kinase
VREARAAVTIQHPNVVHVFTVDMDHDPPFLVMEYVDGISLQAAVARHGTLAIGEAALIGAEIAHGLQAAADVGLVHRDVKPANLLIDRHGRVKILDLGIVHSSAVSEETQPREGSDTIVGTLDYLAPEQAIDSSAVDARADLYALGATLYFVLAGHPPFLGTDVRQKLAAKCYSDPPPIHRLRPDVSPILSAVIQRLLAREPAARYQSATEVAAALTPFAVPPADFPARLFRSNHSTTVNDTQPPGSESALPATVRITRGAAGPHSDPTQPATENIPTAEILKSPTAVEVAVPAELLNAPSVPTEPEAAADRSPWLWGWIFALGVILAILGTFLAFR